MEQSFAKVKEDLSSLVEQSYQSVSSTQNSSQGSRFLSDGDTLSIRSEYAKSDYDKVRKADKVPTCPYQAMALCMRAYDRVGIVNRVVNLMADFVSAGIRLNHRTPAKQRLFRKWWEKINGDDISQKLITNVLKCGNVYTHRGYSNVPMKKVSGWSAVGNTIRIPTHYDFINPLCVEIAGKDFASFIRQPILLLRISNYLSTLYADLSKASGEGKDEIIQEVLDSIPKEILEALKGGKQYVILSREDTLSYHYRRDDWRTLAYPMTYCVLENILLLEKMHLADYSALDGAISNIRLWTMGFIDQSNPNNSLIPGPAAFAKLASILENNVVGGVIDVIWGPELSFKESDTKVHNFLGPSKYAQCMNEIYAGLGIPSSMSSGGGSENYNNNYIAMQTMVKTLNYLRNILTDFWNKELKLLADKLGTTPPKITYQHINFSDETTWYKFLLDMWDREIITNEDVLEDAGIPHDIVEKRIRRERKMRDGGRIPPKAGPYHNSQQDHEYKKIILQQGIVTPSEIGVELKEKENSEDTLLEIQEDIAEKQAEQQQKIVDKNFDPKKKGGRPPGVKDKVKRKPRNTTTPSFSEQVSWGIDAQNQIHSILEPLFRQKLKSEGKLESGDNIIPFEKLKLVVFSNLEPFCDVNEELVYNLLASQMNLDVNKAIGENTKYFVKTNHTFPDFEELKYINTKSFFDIKG